MIVKISSTNEPLSLENTLCHGWTPFEPARAGPARAASTPAHEELPKHQRSLRTFPFRYVTLAASVFYPSRFATIPQETPSSSSVPLFFPFGSQPTFCRRQRAWSPVFITIASNSPSRGSHQTNVPFFRNTLFEPNQTF